MSAAHQVSLREITFETVRSIVNLSVNANQQFFVASNSISISEAHFNPGAWFRAVYAGDAPVGFVMLLDPTILGAMARGPIAHDEVFLWRLMIDHRHQRHGYGKKVLDLICEHIRMEGKAQGLLSSYVVGEGGPEFFYLNYGFRKTGRFRNNGKEIEIILPLQNAS